MNKYLEKLRKVPFSGTIGRPALAGAAIGAAGGASIGAYTSDDGSRLSGALRGGTVGSLIGASLGAAKGGLDTKKLLGIRAERRVEREKLYGMIDRSVDHVMPKIRAHALYKELDGVHAEVKRRLLLGHKNPEKLPVINPPYQAYSSKGLVRLRHRLQAHGVNLKPGSTKSYVGEASSQLVNLQRPSAAEEVRRVLSKGLEASGY